MCNYTRFLCYKGTSYLWVKMHYKEHIPLRNNRQSDLYKEMDIYTRALKTYVIQLKEIYNITDKSLTSNGVSE